MTNSAGDGIIERPENTPQSFHAAGAINVNFEARAEAPSAGSHSQQELQQGLTSEYQYPPLAAESDHIRILDLFPGEEDAPIRARLDTCSLSDRPSYEAISYAWGSKTDNAVVIICEGGVDYNIEIPKSLHMALKRLRHHSEHRSMWADAICMNQADNEEKNHQVRLMRKIYQKATVVDIWLGDDDNIPCRGKSLLEVINQISQRQQALPPPEDRETWTALRRFYDRPWFTRVWCLQEAILALSAKIMLGEHSTSWKHVGLTARMVYDAPMWLRLRSDSDASRGVYHTVIMYWLSHRIKVQQYTPFLEILRCTRKFLASDFRDKIYGILGIPTTDSDPDAGDPFLEPNYTKTLPEVYIKCASVIVQKTQSLRLLSDVQHENLATWTADVLERIEAGDTLVTVPSWVPRWHRFFATVIDLIEEDPYCFKASASMSLDPGLKTEVKGRELVTHGARITIVKSVSRIFDISSTSRQAALETANTIWVEAFDYLEASTTGPTEALYALSTLLTAGRGWRGYIIQDREQHFADLLAFMYDPAMLSDGENEVSLDQAQEKSTRESRSDGTRLGHSNLLMDSLFRPRTDLTLQLAGNPGRGDHFNEAIYNACYRRRLVVTEDGHVGLGPQVTEPGDVVCILKGANVPLLLRPEAGGIKFKLVGEAYIEGMMFGEIQIPEVEQIVLSGKPFVSLDEVRLRKEQLESERHQSG
ncbi:hypothetical protein DHEL01_v211380 [Diaporthe helianthi]|uniref:Heterokaryon incompatibility domain-containing protein n=1 Tax=Diaporthe helianthi TaxID=158607 RepID=A0A2P5HJ08_DIAHE|nr:hypothetical protein DHEL01_v211380 [Diaporthe helianthi]